MDRSGKEDASDALAAAVEAANALTHWAKDHPPQPACITIPTGVYRISKAPPMFRGAGCVRGDGSALTVLNLDRSFTGDLFSWAEAWIAYNTSGATVTGLRINGDPKAEGTQNALMFYDRNDNITLEDLYLNDVPGRAIGTGLLRPVNTDHQAYIRESNFRALRVFGCGTRALPAVEFGTEGTGDEDGTNEVSVSQMDIFAARGASLVIRNSSATGHVRNIKFDALRIEGGDGTGEGDLLQIGDPAMTGSVAHLSFTSLELINPNPGYAALRVTAAGRPADAPNKLYLQGYVWGIAPRGKGLHIARGSSIHAVLAEILSKGPNVVIGPQVTNVVLDGAGAEAQWTTVVDPSSRGGLFFPARQPAAATQPRP